MMIDGRLFSFFCLAWLLPTTTFAFLCGVGELPVGISVGRDGEPLLLCQRSQCLVQSEDLGYTNMECVDELRKACLKNNSFVLAFGRPEKSSKRLSLLCCNHQSLTLRNTTTEQVIKPNSTITVGGPITSSVDKREIGFNLIKNIVKIVGKNNTITYRVIMDRADCQIITSARVPTEADIRAKLQELLRRNSQPSWKKTAANSALSYSDLLN